MKLNIPIFSLETFNKAKKRFSDSEFIFNYFERQRENVDEFVPEEDSFVIVIDREDCTRLYSWYDVSDVCKEDDVKWVDFFDPNSPIYDSLEEYAAYRKNNNLVYVEITEYAEDYCDEEFFSLDDDEDDNF